MTTAEISYRAYAYLAIRRPTTSVGVLISVCPAARQRRESGGPENCLTSTEVTRSISGSTTEEKASCARPPPDRPRGAEKVRKT